MHVTRIRLVLRLILLLGVVAVGLTKSPAASAMICEPAGIWPFDRHICEGYPSVTHYLAFWKGIGVKPEATATPHSPVRWAKCKFPWYSSRSLWWQTYYTLQGEIWPHNPDFDWGYFDLNCLPVT